MQLFQFKKKACKREHFFSANTLNKSYYLHLVDSILSLLNEAYNMEPLLIRKNTYICRKKTAGYYKAFLCLFLDSDL